MADKTENLNDADLDAATGGIKELREGLWIGRGTRVAAKGSSDAAVEEVTLGYTEIEWTY